MAVGELVGVEVGVGVLVGVAVGVDAMVDTTVTEGVGDDELASFDVGTKSLCPQRSTPAGIQFTAPD